MEWVNTESKLESLCKWLRELLSLEDKSPSEKDAVIVLQNYLSQDFNLWC